MDNSQNFAKIAILDYISEFIFIYGFVYLFYFSLLYHLTLFTVSFRLVLNG